MYEGMTNVVLLSILTTFISQDYSSSFNLSLRRDYECEILEKDYYIKDCYRNKDLNFEEREMIASMNARNAYFIDWDDERLDLPKI